MEVEFVCRNSGYIYTPIRIVESNNSGFFNNYPMENNETIQ